MQVGDRVLSVNGNAVKTWPDLLTEVQIVGEKQAAEFVVDRGGTNVVLSITPQRDEVTGGCLIMAYSTTNSVKTAAWMPDRSPWQQLAWDAGSMGRVLKALVTPKESKAAAKSLGGPVMIAEGLYHQVRRDGWDAIGFLRFLNVNLAVLNLLPIPVLDGGLILFSLIALIFRRPVPRKVVDGLSMVFMYLFLALMITLVWRDVARSRRMHKARGELEKLIKLEEKRLKRAQQFKPAFDLGTPAGRAGTPCPPPEKD
jgi:regulator of sigma E protease